MAALSSTCPVAVLTDFTFTDIVLPFVVADGVRPSADKSEIGSAVILIVIHVSVFSVSVAR